ncbi:MAG TPA: hypothetical protein VMD28_00615, partial [Acidimicrobiales bacterium]|nr:hypothetical protein [Acidimicrobiales bacterium]
MPLVTGVDPAGDPDARRAAHDRYDRYLAGVLVGTLRTLVVGALAPLPQRLRRRLVGSVRRVAARLAPHGTERRALLRGVRA